MFVAGFIGSPSMNFLDGTARNGAFDIPGLKRTVAPPVTMPAEGTQVSLGVRPEHLTVDPGGDTHSVELTEALGGVSYAYLTGPTGEKLIVEERGDERTRAGGRVGVAFDVDRAMVFDRESGLRLR
jgi:lactose/L-arabinose transport system ATP-binding protein